MVERFEVSAVRADWDVDALRRDFPIFSTHPRLAYLDNAATTQKPRAVIDAVRAYYERSNANVHRALYRLADEATRAYEAARARVATFLGAASPAEVVFTRGTTESINLVAASYARRLLSPGDEIVLTEMEHHSNLVPWQMAAEERGLVLKFIPVDARGDLDLEAFRRLLSDRTRILSVAHTSNVFGTVNPIAELSTMAHEAGAVVFVDGAQGAAHGDLDVRRLGCDFLALSSHKVYGPMGIGALWARAALLDAMPPYQGGGEMISAVWLDRATYNEVPYKFEAGTPNVAGAVGLAGALDYLDGLGADRVRRHEADLVAYARARLAEVPGLKVYGNPRRHAAVLPFNLAGVHSHDLAQYLDREEVALRSGHHCAHPLMRKLGVPSTARASFAAYNSRDEVDRMAASLEGARAFFGAGA